MVFTGTIIAESLGDTKVLDQVTIVSTQVEEVTAAHATPWLTQWTLHSVEVSDGAAQRAADLLSAALEREHPWYADFKNETEHFIVFREKVFHITDRSDRAQYDAATAYGLALGIPSYQVDFSPHITSWKR